MPDAADHALRREITRLATLRETDLGAILDTLDAHGRRRVELLLQDYAAPAAPRSIPTPSVPKSCSPWLVERIEGRAAGLTPAGQALLADIARRQAEAERASDRVDANSGRRWPKLTARIGPRR